MHKTQIIMKNLTLNQDMRRDEHELVETRWPYLEPRAPPPKPPLGHKAKAYIALGLAATAPVERQTRASQMREQHVCDIVVYP